MIAATPAGEAGGVFDMLSQLIEMMQNPDAYVVEWRGGELYVTPAADGGRRLTTAAKP